MKRRDILKILGTASLIPVMGIESKAYTGKRTLKRLATDKPHVIIYGATPAGIMCAVRAAREGLSVLLIHHSSQIGGMLSNGLSVMDTLYAGSRAPLYDELRRAIHDYYRIKYGPDSTQFAASRPGHPKTYYEAHVVEHIFEKMISDEPGITVKRGFCPKSVDLDRNNIRSVVFQEKNGKKTFIAEASTFIDCSYEADLAAAAKVPYRVGRESRSEFNEEHAGKIFIKEIKPWPPAHVDPTVIAQYKTLNLFHYDRWFEIVPGISTGEADKKIQAYNIRAVLTTNASNQFIPSEPPINYNAEEMKDIWSKKPPYSQLLGPLPNQKYLWNMPELVGPQNDYPDGDWTVRERIAERHRQATLGMLYFLQNDVSLSSEVRDEWRKLGFAKDEFVNNGHLPYEVYARETRRITGRTVFTENDARLAPGAMRSPVHEDSVSVTEWFLDVHACSHERLKDSLFEGELYLNYISHPGQVPYRTMLAKEIDNLLVPVCLSCSHIGWGAIRLEPTWMSLAESAAHAVVLAVENNVSPAKISSDELIRRLANRRVMISFFNDIALDAAECWVPGIQYFGTQGFFYSYDANPLGLLTLNVAREWVKAAAEWVSGRKVDLTERMLRIKAAEQVNSSPVNTIDFVNMFSNELNKVSIRLSMDELIKEMNLFPSNLINRGNACYILYSCGNYIRK